MNFYHSIESVVIFMGHGTSNIESKTWYIEYWLLIIQYWILNSPSILNIDCRVEIWGKDIHVSFSFHINICIFIKENKLKIENGETFITTTNGFLSVFNNE